MSNNRPFVIELVSSGSVDVYKDNTLSSFSNFLPEQVNLDGDWEVALMEVAYPALYLNVTEGQIWYHYRKDESQTISHKIEIPIGLYKSVSDVIDAIHKKQEEVLGSKEPKFRFSIDPFDGRVVLDFPKGYEGSIQFKSTDIAHILGHFPSRYIFHDQKKCSLPADIQLIHSIMIYTDIVEHGIIGDVKAPILRCFPMISRVKNGYIEVNQFMNYQSFDKLQFRKLLRNSFHSIHVDLRSSTGELIPFTGIGLTRLTLIFRKCMNN